MTGSSGSRETEPSPDSPWAAPPDPEDSQAVDEQLTAILEAIRSWDWRAGIFSDDGTLTRATDPTGPPSSGHDPGPDPLSFSGLFIEPSVDAIESHDSRGVRGISRRGSEATAPRPSGGVVDSENRAPTAGSGSRGRSRSAPSARTSSTRAHPGNPSARTPALPRRLACRRYSESFRRGRCTDARIHGPRPGRSRAGAGARARARATSVRGGTESQHARTGHGSICAAGQRLGTVHRGDGT